MKTMSPVEYADSLWVQGRRKEYEDTLSAIASFPDLIMVETARDRWIACSVEANPYVDGVDFRLFERDGDSPLLAWCYVKMDQSQRLYSFPPSIKVALPVSTGLGELPLSNWRKLMLEYNINEEAIEIVDKYLAKHPPCYF